MNIGYILGCLFSILLWNIDRQRVFKSISNYVNKVFKYKILVDITYILGIFFVYFILRKCMFHGNSYRELYNFITAFIVIDISNTERKNLKKRDALFFYDSISTISRSLVCGFIAPMLYVLFLGNTFGIIYAVVYNIAACEEESYTFNVIFIVMSIIPSIITQFFLYFIYITRNKRLKISFEYDYLSNSLFKPVLNVDVMAAYIEGVNFYHHYYERGRDYLKCYGSYSKRIDDYCIKNYLSISYAVCMIYFVVFFLLKYKIG